MKAEERHELKQNDLASWLQYGLPMFLKQNGSYLILGAALVFLCYQLYHLYETKQENARLTAWAEYSQVPPFLLWISDPTSTEYPPARWQGIVDTYDYPDLKVQAYFSMADFYSRIVLFPEKLASAKLTRNEALTKSSDAYKHALDLKPNDPLIAGKAILGMAGVDEDKGDWDAAGKEYESIVKGDLFAKSPMLDVAKDRLATLEERRDAPRLASMIPTTPASQPAGILPGDLGANLPPGLDLPGMTLPPGVTTSQSPTLPGGFGPAIPPELTTTAPATAAPAPATQPK